MKILQCGKSFTFMKICGHVFRAYVSPNHIVIVQDCSLFQTLPNPDVGIRGNRKMFVNLKRQALYTVKLIIFILSKIG